MNELYNVAYTMQAWRTSHTYLIDRNLSKVGLITSVSSTFVLYLWSFISVLGTELVYFKFPSVCNLYAACHVNCSRH